MNKVIFLLFFFVTSASFNVKSEQFAECFGCSNYQSTAEYTFQNSGLQSDTVNVYNLSTGVIKSYHVEKINEPGYSFITSYEQSVPTQLSQEFAALVSARNALKADIQNHGDYIVSPQDASSAYELVGNSQLQNNLANKYYLQMSWNVKVANYIAASTSAVGKIANINLTMAMVFPDGSVATFNLSGIGGDGSLIFVFANAKDSNNNSIPLNSTYYDGRSFSLHSSNYEKFKNNAITLHNVTFNIVYTGHVVSITCSSLGGGDIKCTVQN